MKNRTKTQRKIIIGNWKMNPATLEEGKKLFSGIKKNATSFKKVQTFICPPTLFFNEIKKLAKNSLVNIGAQDTFFVEATGSYTGFISPLMVKNAGGELVIIGHSERRQLGETDEIVNKKILSAEKVGLKIAFCIGEKERTHEGQYLEFIKKQIQDGLQGFDKKSVDKLMIAYEPVWAIGAKTAMSPGDIHVMRIYIRKILTEIFGAELAGSVPVLYGGSVNPQNAEVIMKEGEIDGLLVGRDSLNAENFGAILAIANSIK